MALLHYVVVYFYFGLKFSNQFKFYFSLSQIMVINLKQKKTRRCGNVYLGVVVLGVFECMSWESA